MSNLSVTFTATRFIIYTLAIFGFTLSLPLLVHDGDASAFQEDGVIEWVQFSCLLFAAFIFLSCATTNPHNRELSLWLAALACFAAIREMDATLDTLIPIFSWKVAFLVLIYPAIRILKNRAAFLRQLAVFLKSQAFALLWTGFIVAIPAAQLIGHGPLLEAVMGDAYKGIYKRIIEESGEVIGYMILAIGAIEMYFLNKSQQNAGSHAPDEIPT